MLNVKQLIFSIVCLLSVDLLACDKPGQPIYCAIKTIKPDIDSSYAFKLSNYLYKYSKKYNTDPLISVAIIAQESMFQNINRKQNILVIEESCSEDNVCEERTKVVKGYSDLSLYQFHIDTIRAYKMDPLRLKDDLEYATERHMFLLSEKLRECEDLGALAYTCYHSRSPRYRQQYKQLVDRYLDQIIIGAN